MNLEPVKSKYALSADLLHGALYWPLVTSTPQHRLLASFTYSLKRNWGIGVGEANSANIDLKLEGGLEYSS